MAPALRGPRGFLDNASIPGDAPRPVQTWTAQKAPVGDPGLWFDRGGFWGCPRQQSPNRARPVAVL